MLAGGGILLLAITSLPAVSALMAGALALFYITAVVVAWKGPASLPGSNERAVVSVHRESSASRTGSRPLT